jgi:hypothetical protein
MGLRHLPFGIGHFNLALSSFFLPNSCSPFSPMPAPKNNSDAVISPFDDVQENVRRYNEDEAVWRCFARKRARRKRLLRLLAALDPEPLTEKQLDELDWLAAEREARPVRAIGTWIAP